MITNKISKELIEPEPIINNFTNNNVVNNKNNQNQNSMVTNTKTWKHRANRQRITSTIKITPNIKDLEEYQLYKESHEKNNKSLGEEIENNNSYIKNKGINKESQKKIIETQNINSSNKLDNNQTQNLKLSNKLDNTKNINLSNKLDDLQKNEKIKVEYIEKNNNDIKYRDATVIKGTNKQKKGYDAPINKIALYDDKEQYRLLFDINYDNLPFPKNKNDNGYELYYCQDDDDILLTKLFIGDNDEHIIKYNDLSNHDCITFKLVDVYSKQAPFVIQQLTINLN